MSPCIAQCRGPGAGAREVAHRAVLISADSLKDVGERTLVPEQGGWLTVLGTLISPMSPQFHMRTTILGASVTAAVENFHGELQGR